MGRAGRCHDCGVVLQIGGLLRYPQHGARLTDIASIDGVPNFFYWAHTDDGLTQAHLESRR